jgi:hypothetical protein
VTIELGFEPEPMQLNLSADADFVCRLVAEDGWPEGTQIELRFPVAGSTTVWAATIDGTDAAWNVPAADVAVLVGARPRTVRLHYRSSGSDLLWARGQVVLT